jgi:DNA-binding PadR family transcriptional regulator
MFFLGNLQVARKPATKRKTTTPGGWSVALRKYTREIHFNATFLALLTLLDQAEDDLHAYQLGQQLSGLSDEKFPANQAALYPALRTLRRLKLVAMRQRKNEHGSARQHFRITNEGRLLLAQLWPAWTTSRAFLDLLEKATAPGASSNGVANQATEPATPKASRPKTPKRASSAQKSGAPTNGRLSQFSPSDR